MEFSASTSPDTTKMTEESVTAPASFGSNRPLQISETVNVIVSVVGIVANAFSILVLVYFKKLRQRVGNWLLINQSVLDLLASIMFGGYHINSILTTDLMKVPYLGLAGDLYCKFWASGFWHWTFIGASAYNLVGITVERYLMVVHPLYHKAQIKEKQIAIMCAIPWLLSTLYLVGWVVPTSYLEDNYCMAFAMWQNIPLMYSFAVMELMTWLVIPVVSMSCMYIRMVVVLRSKVGPQPVASGSAAQGVHHLSRAQRNLTKTCIIVVVFFFVMWCPNQLLMQMFTYGVQIDVFSNASQLVLVAVNLNGCVNPFIYAFSYADFRKGILSLFGQKPETSADSSQRTGTNTEKVK